MDLKCVHMRLEQDGNKKKIIKAAKNVTKK